jgi:hypothetical protein
VGTEELPGLPSLLAWRRGMLESGVSADALPPESDLRRIARRPDREGIKSLLLTRPQATRTYMTEILETLRVAALPPLPERATESAPVSEPPEPPEDRPVRKSPPPVETKRTAPARAAPEAVSEAPPPADPPPPEPPSPSPPPPDEPDFTPYAPGADALEQAPPLRTLEAGGQGLEIAWYPAPGPDARIYRVVASDRHRPYSPDDADVVAVTDALMATDERRFGGFLRYVQVWVNEGPSEAAARKAQPRLLAEGVAVTPVQNVAVTQDHGTVTCTWEPLPPGIAYVEVQRIPEHDQRPGYLREHFIGNAFPNGFVDQQPEGDSFEYRIFTVAQVNGRTMMTLVTRTVQLEAPPAEITDLHTRQRTQGGRTVIDLEWTKPRGNRVRIFRTPAGPEPGAEGEEIPENQLPTARLAVETELNFPVETRDGISRITGVPWPDGWSSVYFTPVAVQASRARIGVTQSLAEAGRIEDARLIQRVDWQLLTFDWPGSAAQVQVFVTPVGVPLGEPQGAPVAQLSQEAYEAQGGLRVESNVLNAEGCDVHVLPANFLNGRITYGEGDTIHYPGLLRIDYRLRAASGVRLFGGRARRAFEIRSDRPVPSGLTFVLVHHPERLPLDLGDREGDPIVASISIATEQWTEVPELSPAADWKGFVRLFVDRHPNVLTAIAVMDPNLDDLQVGR